MKKRISLFTKDDYIENINSVERILNNTSMYDSQYRICLIGDSSVGKTSIITRYYNDDFIADYKSTIGCDFKVVTFKVLNKVIKLQVWDTAGQERFKSISQNYFRTAHSFIFVFDLTKRSTFDNLENWISTAYESNKSTISNVLLGNKKDLTDEREVEEEEAIEFAKRFNLIYFETSALDKFQLEYGFNFIVYNLTNENNIGDGNEVDHRSSLIEKGKNIDNKEMKKDGGCC